MNKKWIEFWAIVLLVITIIGSGLGVFKLLGKFLGGIKFGFWGFVSLGVGIISLILILSNKKMRRALQ